MKDLYQILGVPETADEGAVKKAYRKLAKQYHPDVTGGDKAKTERFKDINEAYAVLGDSGKRAEYDRLRRAPVGSDGMPEGFDPEEFARAFGGGAGRAGGAGFEGGFDVGDLFASLFGGAGGRGGFDFGGGFGRGGAGGGTRTRARPSRGADVLGTVEIDFTEAALGAQRRVNTPAGKTVEVRIPPGVESGGRVRVAGHGQPAPGGHGTPGDLYLEITVRPDAHLRRDGDDVEMDLPVSVAEATLGAKVQVPTVEGPVTVTVPPGTSSGARLRLRQRGIKHPSGRRGDQFCRVMIVAPRLTPEDEETRRLFETIAQRTAGQRVRNF